jgi:glycosyltransferase involved in cell wall biosynthesis
MRLFYLSDSALPSPEANSVQVMRMAQAFARTGTDLTLVARRGRGFAGTRSVFADYGVERVFRLLRLPCVAFPGMKRAYGLAAGLLARMGKADLAYCRCLHSAFYAAVLGTPTFYEVHTLPPAGGPADTRWLPRLLAQPQCRGVIAITERLRDDAVTRYRVPARRILVAPDGADNPSDNLVPALPPTDRLRVGFTGQLYPGKGMEVILPLAQACPWAEFHVVGGRELELENWRRSAVSLSNLKFHGFVKPAAVASFLTSFDVVLLPNQRYVLSCGGDDIGRWTSPLKLFEYMAAGKAILASDLPVLREVLEPEVNAILCEPDNLRAWIEGLERLHRDLNLRTSIGQTARRDFRAAYSWDARARLLLDHARISAAQKTLPTEPLDCYEPMRPHL